MSVRALFASLYANAPQQTCVYCGAVAQYSGWDSLCNRTCYYGLCSLLGDYESSTGSTVQPDHRLVRYFTQYPEPTHSFLFEKLKVYLATLKAMAPSAQQ